MKTNYLITFIKNIYWCNIKENYYIIEHEIVKTKNSCIIHHIIADCKISIICHYTNYSYGGNHEKWDFRDDFATIFSWINGSLTPQTLIRFTNDFYGTEFKFKL